MRTNYTLTKINNMQKSVGHVLIKMKRLIPLSDDKKLEQK